MEKEKLREIVKKSVEDCWYNRRSLNPVEEQTEFLTEELYKALRQPPVMKSVCDCGGSKKMVETRCTDCGSTFAYVQNVS
jgi:hypothetical protein